MTRFIALLRGINVGGRNKVPMAELRTLLAGLGYTDVKTHLQSGNAVFSASAKTATQVTKAVEAALAKQYGRNIAVVVRTAAELRAAIDANPLAVDHPSHFLVNFYAEPIDRAKLADLDADAYAPEQLALADREIYYNFPGGMRDAKLPTVVDRKLKTLGTGRNWNTVTKLLELADEA